jgi:prolipoprotein diacylglyceryltransferase
MNGAERFLVELIRVNNKYDLGFIHPTQAELISGGLFLTGCLMIYLRRDSTNPKPNELPHINDIS